MPSQVEQANSIGPLGPDQGWAPALELRMKISSTKKAHERMAALERELLEAQRRLLQLRSRTCGIPQETRDLHSQLAEERRQTNEWWEWHMARLPNFHDDLNKLRQMEAGSILLQQSLQDGNTKRSKKSCRTEPSWNHTRSTVSVESSTQESDCRRLKIFKDQWKSQRRRPKRQMIARVSEELRDAERHLHFITELRAQEFARLGEVERQKRELLEVHRKGAVEHERMKCQLDALGSGQGRRTKHKDPEQQICIAQVQQNFLICQSRRGPASS
eukprot:g20184.t1